MPGSGKSCMGKAVSKKLGLRHLDADRVIEQRTGRKLCDIIAEDGIEAFKKLESETLRSLKLNNVVLSTGGSAIYYPEAMEHLKSLGTVFYLYCSYEVLEERLGDLTKRGVVLKEGQTLKDLYDERVPLYEKYADITVDCSGTDYNKYRERLISVMSYVKDFAEK